MWILSVIPDSMILYFVNIIFYTGIACTVAGFVLRFKFLEQWRLILQVVGVLALGLGLYAKGGYEVEMQWRERVAIMEEKVAAAEAKSQEVNTKVQTKVVEKIKKVKDTKVVTKEVIKEIEKRIDAECTVSSEVVDLLNSMARGEAPALKGDDK